MNYSRNVKRLLLLVRLALLTQTAYAQWTVDVAPASVAPEQRQVQVQQPIPFGNDKKEGQVASVEQAAGTPSSVQLPEAPTAVAAPPRVPQKPMQAYAGMIFGSFCGVGASYSSVDLKPTIGCGVGGNLLLIPIFFEIGVMGPQANRSYMSGYMSVDGKIPLERVEWRFLPVLIGGYSRLFETGHALDYGVALAIRRDTADRGAGHSVQVELRDYWTFANPNQHNVMLRVGWLVGVSD